MNFKVGDSVKFLNARGGGVVTRVIDSRMVGVSVEGGFEIPTLINELVKVDDQISGGKFFVEPEKFDHQENLLVGQLSEEDRLADLPPAVSRNRAAEELFLAYIPHDQKWLISGLMDVCLINNTGYDLLYNLFVKNEDGDYRGQDYGSCFANSRLILATISREELPPWSEGTLQFLFHKEKSERILPPFNTEFKVSGQKFYNESSYKSTPFLTEKAIVVKILSLTDFINKEERSHRTEASKESNTAKGGKGLSSNDQSIIFRHQTKPKEATVDLHITELLDEDQTIAKEEILDFQISYFEQCLDSALFHHFQKVIFIHGVGNGILKEAIITILKKDGGLNYFEAPMQKFGVGAIEVRIPHNR